MFGIKYNNVDIRGIYVSRFCLNTDMDQRINYCSFQCEYFLHVFNAYGSYCELGNTHM